jgi:GMP synthase PP-ATPase subunit
VQRFGRRERLTAATGLKVKLSVIHMRWVAATGHRINSRLHKRRTAFSALLQRPDAIFIEGIRATVDPAAGKSWYDKTRNAFADFVPATSAGVIGDDCTCDYHVALPAMQTSDFKIADCVELPTAR